MTQSISITIEGIGTIPWKGQASLLDALEEAGIDMNYSCRAGVCGACCAKLVSGQIQWRNQPILTLPKQTILTCSVTPTTDITLALPD